MSCVQSYPRADLPVICYVSLINQLLVINIFLQSGVHKFGNTSDLTFNLHDCIMSNSYDRAPHIIDPKDDQIFPLLRYNVSGHFLSLLLLKHNNITGDTKTLDKSLPTKTNL